MRSIKIELGIWVVAALVGVVGAARLKNAAAVGADSRLPLLSEQAAATTAPYSELAAARSEVIESDPFRLHRRPSSVTFSPGAASSESFEPSRAPTLNLVLAGILGGPPWQAVIKGIPGRNSSVVVREGETVEDLMISRVTQDSVVVQGADTSWVLTVNRPWR